jgi:PAS domain S-box-containing protein
MATDRLRVLEEELAEARAALDAIRLGDVDALVIQGETGPRVVSVAVANEAFRSLVDAFGTGAATLDEGGRIVYANSSLARMVGVGAEEMAGSLLGAWFAPEDARRVQPVVDQAVAHATPFHRLECTLRNRSPAGTKAPMHCLLSIAPIAAGKVRAGVVIADITETRERDAAFRRIVELANDGIMVSSQKGELLLANPAALRILGYDSLEDLQAHVPSAAALYARPEERPGMLARLQSDPTALLTVELRRKEGANVWVEVRARPVTRPDGSVHIQSIFRDLTAEHRQRELANHLAAIVQGSSEAIITKDLKGVVRSWNPAATELYGYLEVEAIGVTAAELIFPPGQAGEEEHILAEVAAGRRVPRYETRRRRKDGRILDVSVAIAPIRDGTGTIIGASATAHDITLQKEQIDRLRRSEADLQHAQALAHIGSFTYDIQADAVQGTDELYAIFGRGPAASGAGFGTMLDLVHPDDREAVARNFAAALADHTDFVMEHRLLLPGGEVKWIRELASITYDDAGQPEWAIGTSQDITETRLKTEKLLQLSQSLEQQVAERTAELSAANQDLEAFAYSVSHDLRAPLRAMDGFARILAEDHAKDLSADARHCVEQVVGSVAEMAGLIAAILDFSRASRKVPQVEAVDVQALARDIADRLAAAEPARKVAVTVNAVPSCTADPVLLRQVLENLLGNAFKFTRKRTNAAIEVGFGAHKGSAGAYYVKDNGAGFDMAFADRLFKPFQRLHSAAEFEGTGIGLALVQRIVRAHGGKVGAEGAVEKGATFWFSISMAPRATEGAATAKVPA